MPKKTSAAARQFQASSPLLDMVMNRAGQWALISCGDGSLAVLTAADTGIGPQFFEVTHKGKSLFLSADAEDHAFLSAGEDGRLLLAEPEIDVPTQLVESEGQSINFVASSPDGHRSYAIGQTLYLLNEMAQPAAEPIDLPSDIKALSYAPDGKRLAVAYQGGVDFFWFEDNVLQTSSLQREGAFSKLIWSPDGAFLIAVRDDYFLYGWQLNKENFKPIEEEAISLHGQERVLDFCFSGDGKYLVVAGRTQAVCLSFANGAPWNTPPMLLGGIDERRVTRVAPHPTDEMTALGYDDGMIALAPFDGRMEIMIHPPVAVKGAKVVGLVWNGEADTLVAAFENGQIMLFTMASISKFVRDRSRG